MKRLYLKKKTIRFSQFVNQKLLDLKMMKLLKLESLNISTMQPGPILACRQHQTILVNFMMSSKNSNVSQILIVRGKTRVPNSEFLRTIILSRNPKPYFQCGALQRRDRTNWNSLFGEFSTQKAWKRSSKQKSNRRSLSDC